MPKRPLNEYEETLELDKTAEVNKRIKPGGGWEWISKEKIWDGARAQHRIVFILGKPKPEVLAEKCLVKKGNKFVLEEVKS